MRETIYFKDDDTRLSFLQGNYVTLTNMKDEDIERIINYRLAPINISVHTTNPKLRCEMLHNRFAGNIMERMKKLYDAEIPMNAQIVLCKGYNDGAELDRTLNDLLEYAPVLQSVSVVPVGLTKYREGLCELEPFDRDDALKVIGQIETVSKAAYAKHGIYFAHASDEWYINAGLDFPDEDSYDGYIQLENGVGMSRLFLNEIADGLADYRERQNAQSDRQQKGKTVTEVTTVTGVLAEGIVASAMKEVTDTIDGVRINVYPIRNDFFGERITVTGLLTGGDIAAQLKGRSIGRALILPSNVLKSDEQLFLDDMTVEELQKALQVQVIIVKSSGFEFVQVIEDILSGEIAEDDPVIDMR
jgi:putative radical SAM enzyme (TIGR03279 family)